MKARNHRIKSFVMESGERYCLLVDSESGKPVYHPNLFCHYADQEYFSVVVDDGNDIDRGQHPSRILR